ncbi:MAG: hypothetical protein FJZ43_04415 [Candidatus Staskawiczbacteria bacterium]|nr:hypothetical protein [Candidatus Staskawiczbacteria bacterium]
MSQKEFKYVFIKNKIVQHILKREDNDFNTIKKQEWDYILPIEANLDYPKVGWYFTGACYKHPSKIKFFKK